MRLILRRRSRRSFPPFYLLYAFPVLVNEKSCSLIHDWANERIHLSHVAAQPAGKTITVREIVPTLASRLS
jgi:hypothetical protein